MGEQDNCESYSCDEKIPIDEGILDRATPSDEIQSTRANKPRNNIDVMADKIKKDITPNLHGTKAKVDYEITVLNRGPDVEYYGITEENDHGFVVDITPPLTSSVDPGQTTLVTVTINVDNGAPMSTYYHNITIKVTSRNNASNFTTIILKTRILQTYGVELWPFDTILETDDTFIGNHRVVIFHIDFDNTGTGNDTYKLELLGDYASWATLLEGSIIELGPKKITTFNVTVKVPRETEVDDIPIKLLAISRGDDDKFDEDEDVIEEVTITTKVTQFYELEISSSEVSKKGEPGETIEFTVTVTNQGNGKDSIKLRKDNPNIYWNWILDSTSFDLDAAGTIKNNKPTDTRDVKISVDIPTDEHGIAGYYNITIELESEDTPSSQRKQDEIDLTVKVDPVYEVDLIKDSPTSADGEKVEPGSNVRYVFTVKNKGNIEDTFKISVSGTKSDWVVLQQTSVTIPPYDSEEISLTVNIDDLDDVGVDLEDIKAQKYSIIVKVTSEGDSEEIDEVTINPTVKEKYLIEIEANSDSIEVDPNADPKYETFSITVKNKGNTEDRIEITAKTSTDWLVKFDNKEMLRMDLDIGVSRSVEVKVYAPEKAKNGDNVAIMITATSEDDITKSDPYIISAEVKTSSIKFVNFEISGDKTAGTKVTIKLLVRNDGDVEAENVELRFYDKDKPIHSEKIHTLNARDEKQIEFTYELRDGDHDIRAETEWSGSDIEESKAFSTKESSIFGESPILFGILIIF